jgi:hypothetical protein
LDFGADEFDDRLGVGDLSKLHLNLFVDDLGIARGGTNLSAKRLPQLSLSDLASTAHSIEQVKLIPSRRHSSLPGLIFVFLLQVIIVRVHEMQRITGMPKTSRGREQLESATRRRAADVSTWRAVAEAGIRDTRGTRSSSTTQLLLDMAARSAGGKRASAGPRQITQRG